MEWNDTVNFKRVIFKVNWESTHIWCFQNKEGKQSWKKNNIKRAVLILLKEREKSVVVRDHSRQCSVQYLGTYHIYSNKRRPRLSAAFEWAPHLGQKIAVPKWRLFEEFHLI